MPTAQESELLAETWAEVLDGEIPAKELDAAYIRALRDKKDGFALTANDMVKAHRDNCESNRVPRLPQATNLLSGDVCPRCFGSGLEQFIDAEGYKQSRRCEH
jgi:hypothetical protein